MDNSYSDEVIKVSRWTVQVVTVTADELESLLDRISHNTYTNIKYVFCSTPGAIHYNSSLTDSMETLPQFTVIWSELI